MRVVLDLATNMAMKGKRLPYFAKYRAAASTATGLLKAVFIKEYCDCGYAFAEPTVEVTLEVLYPCLTIEGPPEVLLLLQTAAAFSQNCYSSPKWKIIPSAVLTNTPANTYVRSPGSTQVIKLT